MSTKTQTVTREDVTSADADPKDQLDRRAEAEKRERPRFVIGAKPSPIGDVAKGEHPTARRERNAKPANRAARRDYMKTEEGRAANRKAQENYRSAHPERVQAQHDARAKHGESGGSGHTCAVCGKSAVHKHHDGYGDGEKIRWLCHDHHVKAHHPKSNLGEGAAKSTPSEHGGSVSHSVQMTKSKEMSMSTPKIFEEIMKGAILKGEESPDEMAHRMGAVELKRKLTKAEFKYAKAMKKASDAAARIAAMSKGDGALPGAQGLSHPPMVEHPRPGPSAPSQGSTGDVTNPHEEHPPMVEHPRPGQAGDMRTEKGGGKGFGGFGGKPPVASDDDEVKEQAEKAKRDKKVAKAAAKGKKPAFLMNKEELADEAKKSQAKAQELGGKIMSLRKALSTAEHGEPGTGSGAFTGATRTSASFGAAGVDTGEPFGSLGSMNGMPSVNPGTTTVFSEDDRDVNAEISAATGHMLETGAPYGGAAGLEASAHQIMGGDVSASGGVRAGAGGISKAGALSGTSQNDAARASYIAQYRAGALGTPNFGVGVPPPAASLPETARGQEWVSGMVHYSTSEDVRVSSLMQKSEGAQAGMFGGVHGEPTLNFQAPLLNSRTCMLCKSRVPAMFARCPACGGDHATGQMGGHGAAVMLSKSVADSVRGTAQEGRVHADGTLTIPSE